MKSGQTTFHMFLLLVLFTAGVCDPAWGQSGILAELTVRVTDQYATGPTGVFGPIREAAVTIQAGNRTIKGKADAKGLVKLRVPANVTLRAEASARGYEPASRELTIPEGKKPTIELRLKPLGSVLTVFVRDANPKKKAPAIGGARVKVMWKGGGSIRYTGAATAKAKFIVPPNIPITLVVTAKGYGPTGLQVRVPTKGRLVTALMRPPVQPKLIVKVRDGSRDKPVGDAFMGVEWGKKDLNEISGGDGIAIFHPLEMNTTVTLQIEAFGYASFVMKGIKIDALEKTIVASLTPSEVQLTFRVADASYYKPIQTARIQLAYDDKKPAPTFTPASGLVTVTVPAYTDIRYDVQATFHETMKSSFRTDIRDKTIDVFLTPLMCDVTADVSNAFTGDPIAGAWINITFLGDQRVHNSTDLRGGATFKVPRGQALRIKTTHDDYFPDVQVRTPGGGRLFVPIQLAPKTANFTVFVSNKVTKGPVSGAAVKLTWKGGSAEGKTNAIGHVRFRVPARTRITVDTSATNFGPRRGEVELRGDALTYPVILEPKLTKLTIHAVTDPPIGAPVNVKGAMVELKIATVTIRNYTDAAGRTTIEVPVTGSGTLQVTKDHYHPFTTTLTDIAPSPPLITAKLRPKDIPIRVKVYTAKSPFVAKGMKIEGATVTAIWGRRFVSDTTTAANHARLQIPFGVPVKLEGKARDYKTDSQTITLTEKHTGALPAEARMYMKEDSADLTVTVIDRDTNKPIAGVAVRGNQERKTMPIHKRNYKGTTDAKGITKLKAVLNRSVPLEASKKGYIMARKTHPMGKAGTAVTIKMRKRKKGLRVTVVESGNVKLAPPHSPVTIPGIRGKAIPGASVTATWPAGVATGVTDKDGDAYLAVPDNVTVDILVTKRFYSDGRKTISLGKDAHKADVKIWLDRAGVPLTVTVLGEQPETWLAGKHVALEGAEVSISWDPHSTWMRLTNVAGQTAFSVPPATPIDIHASAKGYQPAAISGTLRKNVTIILKLAHDDFTVEVLGRVGTGWTADPTAPLKGAVVVATWTGGNAVVHTDAAGRATFKVPRGAVVDVAVSAKGYEPGLVKGVKGRFVKFTLEPTTDISRPITVTVSPAGRVMRGKKAVGQARETDIPKTATVRNVAWELITPDGKKIPSKKSYSGRAGLRIVIPTRDSWKLGTYILRVEVQTTEGPFKGEGSFVLGTEWVGVKIIGPLYTGKPAFIRIPELPFKVTDPGKVRISGIGKWADPDFFKIKGRRLYFRPKKPGNQKPEFEFRYGREMQKCRSTVKVRLTELETEVDVSKIKGDDLPAIMKIPNWFERPYLFKITPKKALTINRRSIKRGRFFHLRGTIHLDDLKTGVEEVKVDLTDDTDAIAVAIFKAIAVDECSKPPASLLRYLKRFNSMAKVMARVNAAKADPKAAKALGDDVLSHSIELYVWMGGLKKCRHISPRAQKACRMMADILKRVKRSSKMTPAQGKAFARDMTAAAKAFSALGAGDWKPGFMRGVF
jgi:hypothetical protein